MLNLSRHTRALFGSRLCLALWPAPLMLWLSVVGCSEPDVSPPPQMMMSKLVAYSDRHEPIEPLTAPEGSMDRKVQLGKLLFHDRRLSHDNTISCASCHDVNDGGDDGRRFSIGIGGAVGAINAPTVLNATFNVAQFWDGRASDLASQAAGPIHAPNEMGSNWAEVISKLKSDDKIREEFQSLFSSGITAESITECLVSYERQLVTCDAPFDRYLQGDTEAVSSDVLEGYQIFKDVGCAACHQGKNVGGNLFAQFGVMREFFDLHSLRVKPRVMSEELERHATQDAERIKVPTLRNVELTAPYLHEGSAATLEDAVELMGIYQLGLQLSEREIQLIVAFLHSLTGELREELK